ncbi:hypothetical protein PAXRUDRAFT_685038 [Paxillus rubicundulus Ve08.2h10]|uniref:Uncharacterized protein n=1 Tax=Paxillus rubicundulus Ve08.2h10 TaxID=930991 RepID=A0A0D0DV43_9AGAM|nr:hypothetical protein PAXRUDRAFT_685038 [Paxillus rubicundulus Ve08.2h10]
MTRRMLRTKVRIFILCPSVVHVYTDVYQWYSSAFHACFSHFHKRFKHDELVNLAQFMPLRPVPIFNYLSVSVLRRSSQWTRYLRY